MGASGDAARQIYMGCHPKAQRNFLRPPLPQQSAVNPAYPAVGRRITVFVRPALQIMHPGKRRPVTAQMQFKITGQQQMCVATMRRMTKRVFQQFQKGGSAGLALKQRRNMAQKPPRRRQMQWRSGAVIRQNRPAIQSRGHLPA